MARQYTDQLLLRCTPEERSDWQRAAEQDDRSLSYWMRQQLNQAAAATKPKRPAQSPPRMP